MSDSFLKMILVDTVSRAMTVLIMLQLAACADNVSSRVGVVKQDIVRIHQISEIRTPLEPLDVMAKASSVSASARFYGADGQTVVQAISKRLDELGYYLVKIEDFESAAGWMKYCHTTEAGRFLILTRELAAVQVSSHVRGWSRDKEECPGNRR
ncbi:hypothetical protein [Variovorax sp. PCZ-1]|uniref:hypothetical protein n=1 Tax=Variovorax sp. PCZ-1 TaxID=2835533 RepID=UPI001BD17DD4|nr:hypothetical protein [Variovorax sp. PCZ-1]MBS7806852.1 hypothetical protein [Variovorax sp. PCZ-1]